MNAYRSDAGRDAVAEWCRQRLEQWPLPHAARDLEVTVGGSPVRTHVTTVGEGAPRFVWLPGTARSIACDLVELETLAAHGTVWAVDLPGQPGLSQPTRPRHDTTTWYSAWLEGVLDAVAAMPDAGDVTLVGCALGASVALSADRPSVAGRFLVAPGGLLPATPSAAFARDHTRWSLHASPSAARALARHLVAPGETPDDELVEWMALVGRACKTIRLPRPLPQHYLDRIDGSPLTVVVGEEDVIVPPAALSSTVARRASARVVVVDGAGHLLPRDRWEQVLRVLPS